MAKESFSASNSTVPSTATADTYLGSLLSLTAKSEIRYEGSICYLNPRDSIIGLKNVRLYGTEGRKKNGPQVPPSEEVYQCIMFRGSDIKDLQVKLAPPVEVEDPVLNDPAIIQSNYSAVPSSSSKSVSFTGGSSTELNLYCNSSLNAGSYPSVSPLHHSKTQLIPSPLTQSDASSYGTPTSQTRWQGQGRGPGDITGVHQHPSPSATTSYPAQNPASTTSALTNLQSSPSLPFQPHTLVSSGGLVMPSSLTHQISSSFEDHVVNKAVSSPVSLVPSQSLWYSTPISNPVSGVASLRKQPILSTPNVLQPDLSGASSSKLYPDKKEMGDTTSTSKNFSSLVSSPADQKGILPLPPPSQKLYTPDYTEEFDFQAMNEKFKKKEVWEHFGRADMSRKVEGIPGSGRGTGTSAVDGPEMVPNSNPEPSYHKDDFYDTISASSIGRGAMNGQNPVSQRQRSNSQTFGNFQQRCQSAYGGRPQTENFQQRGRSASGGHRAGRGEYNGQHNLGRGYKHRGRGRSRGHGSGDV